MLPAEREGRISMKKLMRQMKWDVILTSLLYVVLGVAVLVMPDTMLRTLGYLIGAFLIVVGAVSMICYLLRDAHQNYFRNDFVYGLVGIAVGIIVLYKMDKIMELVPIILGVLVVASGCRKLQDVIDMKRMEYGNWVVMLVIATVNVVFGVVLVIKSSEVAEFLFQLVGVGLIVSGVTDCVVACYFAGKIKKFIDRVGVVDSTCVEIVDADAEADKKAAGKAAQKEGKAGQEAVQGTEETETKETETKERGQETGQKEAGKNTEAEKTDAGAPGEDNA